MVINSIDFSKSLVHLTFILVPFSYLAGRATPFPPNKLARIIQIHVRLLLQIFEIPLIMFLSHLPLPLDKRPVFLDPIEGSMWSALLPIAYLDCLICDCYAAAVFFKLFAIITIFPLLFPVHVSLIMVTAVLIPAIKSAPLSFICKPVYRDAVESLFGQWGWEF